MTVPKYICGNLSELTIGEEVEIGRCKLRSCVSFSTNHWKKEKNCENSAGVFSFL